MPLPALVLGSIIVGASVAGGGSIAGAIAGGVSYANKMKVQAAYDRLKGGRQVKGQAEVQQGPDSIDAEVEGVLGFWTFLGNATTELLVEKLKKELDDIHLEELNKAPDPELAQQASAVSSFNEVMLVDLSSRYICDLEHWNSDHKDVTYFRALLASILISCLWKIYQAHLNPQGLDGNNDYGNLFTGVEQDVERSLVANKFSERIVKLDKIHKIAKAMARVNISSLIDLLHLKDKNEQEASEVIIRLCDEVTSQLAFRFEYAILDLTNHSDILKLAELFAAAILRDGGKGEDMVRGVEYHNVKLPCILMQLAIPSDDDRLYGNRSQSITLRSHRNDSFFERKVHPSTLSGLLLRSPYEIYPSGTKVNWDNRDKYPAQRVPAEYPTLIILSKAMREGKETVLPSESTSASVASTSSADIVPGGASRPISHQQKRRP